MCSLRRGGEFTATFGEFGAVLPALGSLGALVGGLEADASVGAVLEKLLRPKRTAFSDTARDEVHEAQGHRCSICDAELG